MYIYIYIYIRIYIYIYIYMSCCTNALRAVPSKLNGTESALKRTSGA